MSQKYIPRYIVGVVTVWIISNFGWKRQNKNFLLTLYVLRLLVFAVDDSTDFNEFSWKNKAKSIRKGSMYPARYGHLNDLFRPSPVHIRELTQQNTLKAKRQHKESIIYKCFASFLS